MVYKTQAICALLLFAAVVLSVILIVQAEETFFTNDPQSICDSLKDLGFECENLKIGKYLR